MVLKGILPTFALYTRSHTFNYSHFPITNNYFCIAISMVKVSSKHMTHRFQNSTWLSWQYLHGIYTETLDNNNKLTILWQAYFTGYWFGLSQLIGQAPSHAKKPSRFKWNENLSHSLIIPTIFWQSLRYIKWYYTHIIKNIELPIWELL